jgi:hypothetical protein
MRILQLTKPYGITSQAMISPQIHNMDLHFHYAFGEGGGYDMERKKNMPGPGDV